MPFPHPQVFVILLIRFLKTGNSLPKKPDALDFSSPSSWAEGSPSSCHIPEAQHLGGAVIKAIPLPLREAPDVSSMTPRLPILPERLCAFIRHLQRGTRQSGRPRDARPLMCWGKDVSEYYKHPRGSEAGQGRKDLEGIRQKKRARACTWEIHGGTALSFFLFQKGRYC